VIPWDPWADDDRVEGVAPGFETGELKGTAQFDLDSLNTKGFGLGSKGIALSLLDDHHGLSLVVKKAGCSNT
tara:strand:- start:889 stop:1104 length:216 start_codon:yes stop_codon:yes gene_type:complete